MNRNLDGIYFRVKRNGKYENVCFSDLEPTEIEEIGEGRSAEWWKKVALHLKQRLIIIGKTFDIMGGD